MDWTDRSSKCSEELSGYMSASLAQLARSLTANQKVSGSIPGMVEG